MLYPFVESAVIDELFDDDADGSVDTTVYDALVAHVEAQFHSYISRRYAIPLDVTDATILAIAQFYCARLFEYHAHARRNSVDAIMGTRYNMTIGELENIRDGKLGLNDTTPIESPAATTYSDADEDHRCFDSNDMADWGGRSTR